jgi:hypothetical protein
MQIKAIILAMVLILITFSHVPSVFCLSENKFNIIEDYLMANSLKICLVIYCEKSSGTFFLLSQSSQILSVINFIFSTYFIDETAAKFTNLADVLGHFSAINQH